jgi:hypothetical protein
MSPSTVFAIAQIAPLPFWFALLFPSSRLARWLAFVPLFVLAGCVAYGFALVQAPAGGSTFADVIHFFSSEWGAVVLWLHVVVADYLVGVWIARDARRLGVSSWVVAPLLGLTLFFAPIGVGAWVLLRGVWKRQWRLDIG